MEPNARDAVAENNSDTSILIANTAMGEIAVDRPKLASAVDSNSSLGH